MIEDVTLTGVHWNDPVRVERMLALLSERFRHVVLGCQVDGDPEADPTYLVCRKYAERVVVDRVRGYCEPTIGRVASYIKTPWALLIDGDQLPSPDLLDSLPRALVYAGLNGHDALELRMVTRIDGIGFGAGASEPAGDFERRLWMAELGWPTSMHDRPHATNPGRWDTGWIDHDRSLDEMMRDYLGFFEVGKSDEGITRHNRFMMRGACEGVAAVRGWPYVHSFPWWPAIQRLVGADEGTPGWD